MSEAPALILSDIKRIEKACRIVAEAHAKVKSLIAVGVRTRDLDKVAEDFILSQDARPAFKGYRMAGAIPFPATLCISVNDVVVHGFPSEYQLQNGDIVSVDCGVEKDGYYGDSAYTYAVGEISEENQKLLQVTNEALYLGIEQAIAGNKVYQISGSIQRFVERNGFSVVRELVGHGVGKNLHEEPSIPNFVPPLLHRSNFPNAKLRKGQTLAIEPMVNAGKKEVKYDNDGWTVRTKDGKASAHFEHTVMVDDGKAVILTLQ